MAQEKTTEKKKPAPQKQNRSNRPTEKKVEKKFDSRSSSVPQKF